MSGRRRNRPIYRFYIFRMKTAQSEKKSVKQKKRKAEKYATDSEPAAHAQLKLIANSVTTRWI